MSSACEGVLHVCYVVAQENSRRIECGLGHPAVFRAIAVGQSKERTVVRYRYGKMLAYITIFTTQTPGPYGLEFQEQQDIPYL